MNSATSSTPTGPDPRDGEIDQLLASRFRDTTPAFERRWVDLQRELRRGAAEGARLRPARRWSRPAWWGGALVALSGAAAALLLVLRPTVAPTPNPTATAAAEYSPAFVELLEINDLLHEASPLLDAENRDALLHLAAAPTSHT
ncbi:hypothetical protein [Actomonas aquatica]|uniref:Anti sigma-E protein RseA N-terminal domain-containing protein n=1 Tax=Actomonas aquatica TaxID=2866162 RepID=A0ABZ1C5N1_9BACT|nr:hypothetical protein [Opitutus sp. WL0086]WRQ86914.1 hypothetical protein K1X11_019040 [Opitutus sp. WL0086]